MGAAPALQGGEQSLIPGLPDHLVAQRILSTISWWDYDSGVQVSRGWRLAFRETNSIRPSPSSHRPKLLGCLHPASPKKPKRIHHEPPVSTPGRFFEISLLSVQGPSDLQSWEALPPIPGLSCGAPLSGRCVALGDRLYVIGGRDPQSWEFISDVFVIDLCESRRVWRRCAPMSTARSAFACVAANGRIFVAGGQGDEVLTLASAEVYDPRRDAWEPLPDLNVPRTECNAAVIGDRVCILGGYSSRCEPTCELDDEQETVTFWVSSADTIRMGSRRWETVEKLETGISMEVGSGILQSVHRSVVRDFSRRCGTKSWSLIDGKVGMSGFVTENGAESEVMFLATACGKDWTFASSCSVDPPSGKVKVSLCRALTGDADCPKLVGWEKISCPFELSRYGASCFLV